MLAELLTSAPLQHLGTSVVRLPAWVPMPPGEWQHEFPSRGTRDYKSEAFSCKSFPDRPRMAKGCQRVMPRLRTRQHASHAQAPEKH